MTTPDMYENTNLIALTNLAEYINTANLQIE
jgi:hypothetical protein